MKNDTKQSAIELHKHVPPDWYYRSVTRDKNIVRKLVHLRRFKEVGKLIEPAKGKLLDIGCADGMFTKVILDKSGANEVIGVDILEKSVNWANNHWKNVGNMHFIKSDAHDLPFKNLTFDAVFALEVLEHVYEPIKVLQEIKRVLKDGGYAVFLVPTESLLFQLVWYFWVKYTASRIWQETHIHAYSGNFLVKLTKAMGFKITEDKKIIFGTLHAIKVRKV
jgi:2-polyprenyl-3-methyl-5-hydroxy-6-metoxy-1,4-benzoquinol methylase